MRRRLIRVCVLVIIGMVITVLLSWMCMTQRYHTDSAGNPSISAISSWFRDERNDEADALWFETHHPFDRRLTLNCESTTLFAMNRGRLTKRIVAHDAEEMKQFWRHYTYVETQYFAGWPMHAMTGRVWEIEYHNLGTQTGAAEYIIFYQMNPAANWSKNTVVKAEFLISIPWTHFNKWSWAIRTPEYLPLQPICLGFAMNTLLYASVCWFLALGPSALRRALRRQKGCCLHCGYDLRGGTSGASGASGGACPECGALSEPRP